jgi:putative hydrolase of the HAD superfamily
MPRYRSFFFDVGNTLLFPNRTRILAPLEGHRQTPPLEQWLAVERRTKPEFDQRIENNDRIDHGFWWFFYTELLRDLPLVPGLAHETANDDRLRDALVANTQLSANWDQIRPGTVEALGRIAQDYSISVISNADGKIEAVLRRCGIADCFQSITDSGIVGYEKPHPAIFAAALQKMDAKPADSLYVGDVYSVDYLGALNAGMKAVLFDVSGSYRERNLPRVESLAELEDWLKQ